MKLNLSSKIIIIIEIAVLVVAISSGVTALLIQKNTLEKLTNTQLQSVSALKEYNIKRYTNLAVNELRFYSERKETRDIFVNFLQHNTKVTYQETHTTFSDMLAENAFFLNAFLMNETGVVVASTDVGEEGKIRSGESFFVNAKKETAIQDFYYNVTTGSAELIITSPITDGNGVFHGVLATKIKFEDVSNILAEKSGLGATGETYLINSFHLVVTDLLKEPGVALKKTIYLPQIEDCLQGNSNYGAVTDYHGDNVFSYWHWIPEIKSCLVTKEDQAEALAPMQNITISLLSIIGIASLFIGIIGYLIGKSFVRPLGKLRDFALRIKEGNFNIEKEAVSDDEIGEIISSFNGMAEQLSKYTENLQSAVEEKTLEINKKAEEYQQLNKLMIGREVKMVELKKENEELRRVTLKK